MKFVSVDGESKRVAHTSGVIESVGAEPVELPTETIPGLTECAMAAGCVPYENKKADAKAKIIEAAKLI